MVTQNIQDVVDADRKSASRRKPSDVPRGPDAAKRVQRSNSTAVNDMRLKHGFVAFQTLPNICTTAGTYMGGGGLDSYPSPIFH